MDKERINNYNEHAKFLSDIALSILHGNKGVLDINGVKEIISLYLLIPYMTEDKLTTPGSDYVIPPLSGVFIGNISFADLRNTICHSFVTVEEDKCDDVHGKCLIFDDRIVKTRHEHDKMDYHSEAYSINIKVIHQKLLEMVKEIQQYRAE